MPGLYEHLQNSRLCPLPRGVGVDALHPHSPFFYYVRGEINFSLSTFPNKLENKLTVWVDYKIFVIFWV